MSPNPNQNLLDVENLESFQYTKQIKGSFDTSLFQSRYQRNNKRGGLKHLRCFPTCGKLQ
jgi:hypothetical protein